MGSNTMVSRVCLESYDIVVFDCDGVLLDSNGLKTLIFERVLSQFGFSQVEIDRFRDFQVRNFGISRYRLFEAAIEGRFGDPRDVALADLLDAFGAACRAGYMTQAKTPGMRQALIRAGEGGRSLYVVSGSDEAELREVLDARGFGHHFAAIFGSPATKLENLKKVMAHQAARGSEARRILFVGDAEADAEAADAAGVDFLFMAAYSTVRQHLEPRIRARGGTVIEDLRELT